MSQSFRPSVVAKFQPHIRKSTHTLLQNLAMRPNNFEYYIRHMAAELILLITYGIQVQPENDPLVQLAERALTTLTENTVPGKWLVDAFPWLKYVPEWLPFTQFKHLAKEWKKYATSMVEVPYRAVREDILLGRSINCLVAEGLRDIGDSKYSEEWEGVVKNVAGMVYTGASDTTVATILNGILALMCYPEVLKKAQAEIDALVPPGRLPELEDQKSLPYLAAVIKEIWRWSPVVPYVVHFIETEDVYKGYIIPAQSIVVANIWAMCHDEVAYPDSFTFNPERFLKDGELNTSARDPEGIVFGFGRRDCPGKHFASMSVWLTMACIIALFDISKPVDENGNIIEPTIEWESASVAHPVPFKCRIVPRSDNAAALIQQTEKYEYFTE
ncbi:hypothetical protein AX16_001494 [Volvariella volvacea WC 439]|nr:hypothetical protein AX16_001494 [Volvariella volvacea WC 439]